MTAFIPFISDAEVEAIGLGVIDRTLPKPRWTHAAHFAAAVWMIRRRPDLAPERDLPGIIRAYNEATGVQNTDTGGYHETITLASLRAAKAFLAARACLPLYAIANALMESDFGDKNWLLVYWTAPVLFSADARRRWVEPDIQPLPF